MMGEEMGIAMGEESEPTSVQESWEKPSLGALSGTGMRWVS